VLLDSACALPMANSCGLRFTAMLCHFTACNAMPCCAVQFPSQGSAKRPGVAGLWPRTGDHPGHIQRPRVVGSRLSDPLHIQIRHSTHLASCPLGPRLSPAVPPSPHCPVHALRVILHPRPAIGPFIWNLPDPGPTTSLVCCNCLCASVAPSPSPTL
jgi:hypothetical protein